MAGHDTGEAPGPTRRLRPRQRPAQGRTTDARGKAAFRARHNAWFDRHLVLPTDVDPTVYDHDLNPGAVAWFRATALTCLERVPGYLAILDAHGIPWERVEAHHAGRVVYEDDLQVVAVPVP
ncbi:MAG: hypothetical protein ACXVXS_16550 [Blastococcus sp.]